MNLPLLVPDWPAPAHVRATFTTRLGGVSRAPFDSLNLGDHVHDDPQNVASNRALLHQAIRAKPVFLQQVHGCDVAHLGAACTLVDKASDAVARVADACATQARGVACTIMVADCLPVLFTDRAGSFVAAAHAGWRGLLGSAAGDGVTQGVGHKAGHGVTQGVGHKAGHGVLEQVVHIFRQFPYVNIKEFDTKNIVNDVLVWLGPCIGPQHFEVGAEVREAFIAGQSGAQQHFDKTVTPAGQPDKYLANLSALARDRLQALGFTHIYGNDGSLPWCTAANASEFFSHRRDAARFGSTGRMAACIWLAD